MPDIRTKISLLANVDAETMQAIRALQKRDRITLDEFIKRATVGYSLFCVGPDYTPKPRKNKQQC